MQFYRGLGLLVLTPLIVAAQCNEPSLTIGPVEWGAPVGGAQTASISVVNTGGGDATLGEISTARLGLLPPFSLEGGTCTTGAIVPKSSGKCTLQIGFSPPALERYQTGVTVEYSAAGSSVRTASAMLSATGNAPLFIYRAYGFEFFDRPLGSTNTTEYRIMNSADYPVQLGDLSDTGLGLAAPFSHTGGTCVGNAPLAPRTECSLTISYAPTAVALSHDDFAIRYTWLVPGPQARTEPFSIHGSSTPALHVSADSHYFAPTAVGASRVSTLSVRSLGGVMTKLGDMSAAGLGLAAPFSIAGGTCRTGLVLMTEDETCTLDVRFTPTTAGFFSDQVTLAYSWSGGAASLTVLHAIAGTAVATTSNDCYQSGCAVGEACASVTTDASGPGTCIPIPPAPPNCIAPCLWEARRRCLPVLDSCNQEPLSTVLTCDPETRWAAEMFWPYRSAPLGFEYRKEGRACYSERLITTPGDSGTVFSNGTATIGVGRYGSDANRRTAQLVWCGPYTSPEGLHESDAFFESDTQECRNWRETYLGARCRTTQPGSCAGL